MAINHAYRVLYGRSDRTNPSGIYVDNHQPIIVPDVLLALQERAAGSSVEQADLFAINCLRILDGSSYRGELTAVDSRITYQLDLIGIGQPNMLTFINRLITVSPAAVQAALAGRQELEKTFRKSDVTQEVAASLIVGYIREVTEANA